MKINNILKLSSLGVVSLGLVSTVVLTSTSCGDGLVSTIKLFGEFTTLTTMSIADPNVKIPNIQSLEANDKSTTTVSDANTLAAFEAEAEGAKIVVRGYIKDDNSFEYIVTFNDVDAGNYKFKGYYIYDDGSTSGKIHAVTVKLTVVEET
jgi:hypothetical protein